MEPIIMPEEIKLQDNMSIPHMQSSNKNLFVIPGLKESMDKDFLSPFNNTESNYGLS